MQTRHLLVPVRMSVMLALATSIALLNPQRAKAEEQSNGASYVITVYDSSGAFASRGVITLHADHTMSVIDSGQGGPTFFFSSQLGAWKPDGVGGIQAQTVDFDFPPNEDVARLNYTIKFGPNPANQITGTITLTVFPLQGDPQGPGGTILGTFTFTGNRIRP